MRLTLSRQRLSKIKPSEIFKRTMFSRHLTCYIAIVVIFFSENLLCYFEKVLYCESRLIWCVRLITRSKVFDNVVNINFIHFPFTYGKKIFCVHQFEFCKNFFVDTVFSNNDTYSFHLKEIRFQTCLVLFLCVYVFFFFSFFPPFY